MRVLPILFNTEMVRAILDERQTCTRRIIKKDKIDAVLGSPCRKDNPNIPDKNFIEKLIIPPYQKGDILYVRETWCWCPCWDCGMDTEDHNCCDVTANKFYNHDRGEYGCYGYKASFPEKGRPEGIWSSSIHMPKAAARIWLKVTDVRVERLQDITEEQAMAEGASVSEFDVECEYTNVNEFCSIWNMTLKKSELEIYGWDANPWVWVIEFERCEKPEEVL